MITHDMGAVSEMADRVAVMYAGRIIEEGQADDVLDAPRHHYTRGLIGCIPSVDDAGALKEIPGVVPPLHMLGAGCAFAERCGHARAVCRAEKPGLTAGGHRVACIGAQEGWA